MTALLEKEAVVRVCSLKGIQSLQRILRLIEQTLVQRRQVKRAPLRRRAAQQRADRRQRLGVPASPSETLDAAQLVDESVSIRFAMTPGHRIFTFASSTRNGPFLTFYVSLISRGRQPAGLNQ
jgi:hypothetical protein